MLEDRSLPPERVPVYEPEQLDAGGDVLLHAALGMPDLNGVEEVYITSRAIGDGTNLITSGGSTFSVIAHIPMTVGFGAINHWETFHEDIDQITYPNPETGKSLRDCDIQIRDRHGDLLDMQGRHMNMILKATTCS